MASELTDLLPSERKLAFVRDYFFRLGTVVALVVAVLLLMHGIMLSPAYFNLSQAKANEQGRLASLKERLASSDDQEIIGRLADLDRQTKHLSGLGQVPSATAAVRQVLALPRSGITLSGFAFTPPLGRQPGLLRITGTAASRASLRAYQSMLASVPTVSSVDLPISAYAKESDISFSVTLTGMFIPTPS